MNRTKPKPNRFLKYFHFFLNITCQLDPVIPRIYTPVKKYGKKNEIIRKFGAQGSNGGAPRPFPPEPIVLWILGARRSPALSPA